MNTNQATTIAIIGPPGSGKTQLAHDMMERYCNRWSHLGSKRRKMNLNQPDVYYFDEVYNKSRLNDIYSSFVPSVHPLSLVIISTTKDNLPWKAETVIVPLK